MMPLNPTVSVLVPLYNKAAFVEATIRSVVAQDYQNFELLIVDDGSTDDGLARLQAAFYDSRIRIIRQAHAGVGAARNHALCQARANILAFLDADDEWSPTHLSDLLYLAQEFPQAGILATGIARKTGDKLVIENTIRSTCPCLIENYFALAAQPRASFVNSSSCAVRRDVVGHVGGFLESMPYGEDEEYWGRISLWYPMAFHPRVSAIYRIDVPGSATSLSRWEPGQPPVVQTLKQYLTSHPAAANQEDVLNYAAWILLNRAASGIGSGPSNEVRKILTDQLLNHCQFQRRLRALRLSSAMPERLARTVLRIHTAPWAASWRSLYAKITRRDPVQYRISGNSDRVHTRANIPTRARG